MISAVFHTVVYQPIYNALVFFVGFLPTHDIGIAVIIVTILVRLVLYPLAMRAVRAQIAMKQIAPDIEELKKKYKDKPQEQSQAIFALYKERGVHPFAGLLLVLAQLPVLLGLYWVFARGGFPTIDQALLYSFVHVPAAVNMHFLGLIDMGAKHNIVLAILVAASQFAYTRLSMGPRGSQTPVEAVESSFSTDMAKSFDLQARFMFPVMFAFIAYFVVAAAPLYWLTGNLFMIGQEFAAGRRFGSPSK